MKKLLSNLSRIPPKVSFIILGASLVFGYVLTLGTAIAFDLGVWMRDSINDQYQKLTSPDKPAQQIQRRVEEWQRSQCEPQPVPVQPVTIEPTLPGDRLVRMGDDRSGLTDPIAIALFNIAPGNTVDTHPCLKARGFLKTLISESSKGIINVPLHRSIK